MRESSAASATRAALELGPGQPGAAEAFRMAVSPGLWAPMIHSGVDEMAMAILDFELLGVTIMPIQVRRSR